MNIKEKIESICKIIYEIEEEDPLIAEIMYEGYTLSLSLLKTIAEKGTRLQDENLDVSEHINIISRILNINLETLITEIIKQQGEKMQESTNAKEADPQTLEFITSDLDDYEKFLAKNKAKENLEFLSGEI